MPAAAAPPTCPAEEQPLYAWATEAEKRAMVEACVAVAPTPSATPPATVAGEVPPPTATANASPTVETKSRRIRLGITAGFMFGQAMGVAVGLPIRIGLLTVKLRPSLPGTAALVLQPWALFGIPAGRDPSYMNFGGGVTLAAGWEQRLGPIEVFPRVGATAALAYRMMGANAWRFDLMIKALLGVCVAWPAGEGKKLLAGFDGHVGPENLLVAYLGAGF